MEIKIESLFENSIQYVIVEGVRSVTPSKNSIIYN